MWLLRFPNVNCPVDAGDKRATAYHVADGHRNQVCSHAAKGNPLGAIQHSDRDQEHVRHRMLEAQCDEGGNGEDERHDLARDAVRGIAQPDREADQHVAHHPAQQGGMDGQGNLRLGDGDDGLGHLAAADAIGIAAPDHVGGSDRSGESDADARSGGRYARLVTWALGHRLLVLGAATVATAISIALLSQSGTELFPRVDTAQFQIQVNLQPGTRIENTEKTIARIEQILLAELGTPDPEYPAVENHPDSDLRMLITNIGVLMDWPAAYTPNAGPMDAFVLVQLKQGRRDVFEVVSQLRRRLNREFPQAVFSFDTGGMLSAALNFGEPAPIHFQTSGSDLATLSEIGRRVASLLTHVEGAADVRVLQSNDYPTLVVDIDRTKAALAGLNVRDVMHNLVTATNSSINFAPAFWIDERNGNHYFIGAQYAQNELVSVETLLDIPIAPEGGGTPVPLRTIATVSRGTGPSVVSHRNITRVVDVYANVASGYNVGDVVAAMESALEADPGLALEADVYARGAPSFTIQGEYSGRGYTLTATGEIETMRNAFGQFAGGLALAALLVYLVMVAQFKSFIDPLMVLFTVPLGFIGVGSLLFATGTTVNIQSVMGMIMMVGIVVEYGILLVHFANDRVQRGVEIETAIRQAALVRLRPILMTSLTTVLALAPMALGIGGAQANIPLARTIIGGVLSATVLTLFVLPCVYVLMKRVPVPSPTADGDIR